MASPDDAARSLLNKFLGAQVMMTGMESMMAQSASSHSVTTSGAGQRPTTVSWRWGLGGRIGQRISWSVDRSTAGGEGGDRLKDQGQSTGRDTSQKFKTVPWAG